jgi:2-polyprenyl-3-methyl-5-hydroxy-6-metoxy-1,4-benzoquinol methylase
MVMEQPQNSTSDFEVTYLAVREREQRVYTDEQVKQLPNIDSAHVHYPEWQIRKRSADQLIAYLHRKKKPLKILEIGCGNGWLSAQMAKNGSFNVTGLDINQTEINQAARGFKSANLQFVCDAFNEEGFKNEKFDIILFAAVLPYFSSAQQIIQTAVNKLSTDGEVHILDTHFYESAEVEGAHQRCVNYYNAMGFPEMAANYFHYTHEVLDGFNYQILVDPRGLINRLKKKRFYWISIKK